MSVALDRREVYGTPCHDILIRGYALLIWECGIRAISGPNIKIARTLGVRFTLELSGHGLY